MDAVTDALYQGYGFAATGLRRLGSEVADTFFFEASADRYVAKFHHIDTVESLRVLDWQGEVQRVLHASGQPVPRCVAARDGGATFAREDENGLLAVQVMDWNPGIPLIRIAVGPAMHHRLGAAAGRFHAALQFAPPPPSLLMHDWDVRRLDQRLDECVSLLAPSPTREACAWALEELRTSGTMGRLADLPAAIIHQDLNDSNILLTPEHEVAAVLDFGDMTYGPRVAEVAVLAAYICRRSHDPNRTITEVLQGFASEVEIDDSEADVVVPLVTGRLALNLASNALRLDAGHRAEYANERITGSFEALERLANSGIIISNDP